MTESYAEDSGNTEPSDEKGEGHDDPAEDFDGEFMPTPPPTATEDPDTRSLTDEPVDPEETPTSPGVG